MLSCDLSHHIQLPGAELEYLGMCRWNFTPSPGWTKEEAAILKLCLMKYGVGKWVQILETGLLPGKLIQQLNGQAQRLLGQQSLAGAALLLTSAFLSCLSPAAIKRARSCMHCTLQVVGSDAAADSTAGECWVSPVGVTLQDAQASWWT